MAERSAEEILFLEKLNADNEALAECEDTPDAVRDFIECQKLALAIGGEHATALSQETANVERTCRAAIKASHGAASPQAGKPTKATEGDEPQLRKRASGETRIEKTVIGSTTVCAVLDSENHVVKTYRENAE